MAATNARLTIDFCCYSIPLPYLDLLFLELTAVCVMQLKGFALPVAFDIWTGVFSEETDLRAVASQ
jgi:hypothetical protein